MSLSLTEDGLAFYAYNKYFVETGTYKGGGIQVALDVGFEHIISIEIDPELYKIALKIYEEKPNVKLILGDSALVLWNVIKDIHEPITFWLDSHIVEENMDFEGYIDQVPLMLELDIIKRHPIKTHTILVDDRRMMAARKLTGGWMSPKWKEIKESAVVNKLLEINPDYIIEYQDSKNDEQDIIVARPQ